ncbi:MAG: FAD-binding oxidoreductase [Chloroflexi bacterium]|nr:FAD-binding oxidoreductase [Chloroflexota bacterium]
MQNTADVIIIGGGVHGASLAFHLSQRDVKVIVMEKNFIASGATGRSSGLLRMHYDFELESKLAWESFQYFRNWAEIVGGDCGFMRTGFFQFAKPETTQQLRANVAMHQSIGIPSELVTPEDVTRLAPHFNVEGMEIAAYEPESGHADPNATTASFFEIARQKGTRLIQDCHVTAIHTQGGKITGVDTSQGKFTAPIVVNVAGAWAAEIAQLLGLEIPVDTWQHDVMFVNRPAEMGDSHPAAIDFQNSMYFRSETGGLTLVGLDDDSMMGGSPDNPTDHAQKGFVEKAIERICSRIPIMEKASLHSAYCGIDGITPDQRGIIGKAGPDGFYLQCGFSGTGFKISPAVGACMSELIVDGQAQLVDITPFRFERFAEDELISGEHSYGNIWH